MRFLLLSILLLSVCHVGLSQVNELYFSSDSEKQAFEAIHSGETYFEVFMLSNGASSQSETEICKEKLEHTIQQLKSDGIQSRSEKKQSKLIYGAIHDSHFKKYDYKNQFPDVFRKGYYNCVSATAIYAYVFEQLDIPYQIIEQPTHVYALAWPDGAKIVFEATNPQNGTYSIDDRTKERYISYLIANKIIDKSEFQNQSYVEIYDAYFFQDMEKINMVQLAGIQYANYGLYKLENEKYKEALEDFRKAAGLYPKEGFLTLVNLARTLFLSEPGAEIDERYVDELGAWANDTLNDDAELEIGSFYLRVIEQKLKESVNHDEFIRLSNRLIRTVDDSTTRASVRFFYHYEFSRIANLSSKLDLSLAHADTVLGIRGENIDVRTMFLVALVAKIQEIPDYSETLELLADFEARHPVLLQEVKFQTLYAEIYLRRAYDQILNRRYTSAEPDIASFEQRIEGGSSSLVDDAIISAVYGDMVGFEFVRGRKSKAREYVERGLKYSPRSTELLNRKRMLY